MSCQAVFFWIWLQFLRRDPKNPLKYGGADEIFFNYLWFLIGVFGLGLSKYGLVGLEAAMLQTTFWKPPNAAALLMHGGNSWSGPGGWIEGLKMSCWERKYITHRLWVLLVSLSLLPFIALTLSGLCLELSDGYVQSSNAPMVIGYMWEDFHRRQERSYYSDAAKRWETGSPAKLPGLGLIYTPEYLQRGQYSGLQDIPNTLPLNEGIPEIFLAPQAKVPISGNAWGLRAGYNCSIVRDASQFTIIGQKSSSIYSSDGSPGDKQTPSWASLVTPSNEKINIFTGTMPLDAVNLLGYIEMGVSNVSATTYDGTEPSSFNSKNMDRADILEFSLWQIRIRASYEDDKDLDFDSRLDPTIRGMGQPFIQTPNRSYVANDTFFMIRSNNEDKTSRLEYYNDSSLLPRIVSAPSPIGVRCRVVSTLGTAELNPAKSTFHSFKQTPSPPFNASIMESETPRLGNIAAKTMIARYLQIFKSVNAPPPITVSNSYQYQSYIQPQSLQKSIMLAYATDALQLMYDGTYGFEGARNDTNLKSSRPGKILTVGKVPPAIPAVIFAIWAFGCVLLGVWFGFRRRWSDSLDGFSFFQFGVELANEVKDKPDFLSAKEFRQSETLWSLPGSLKDMRSNNSHGPLI